MRTLRALISVAITIAITNIKDTVQDIITIHNIILKMLILIFLFLVPGIGYIPLYVRIVPPVHNQCFGAGISAPGAQVRERERLGSGFSGV